MRLTITNRPDCAAQPRKLAASLLTTAIMAVGGLLGGLSPIAVQADVILADSLLDWDAAVNDGLDANGLPVTPGSIQDAPQHGHTDSAGNGIWNYKGTNSPSTGTFSATPGFFTEWNGSAWGSTTQSRARRQSMAPTSTISGSTYTVREWIGTGLVGEMLRLSGFYSTEDNNALPGPNNNGVRAVIVINQFVLLDEMIAPGDRIDFDLDVVVPGDNPRIRFTLGPDGPIPGAGIINDFFNDSTLFEGRITLVNDVPAPAMGILLLIAGLLTGFIPHRSIRHTTPS